jgi:hypothetical protein
MDLLIVVSTPKSDSILMPLANACTDEGIKWAVFFTNDSVSMLGDEKLVKALGSARQAVVCHDSWNKYMSDKTCPLELGSQTNNSALLADASRVLSL